MGDELLSEVLAAHADHLNLGGENTETYLAMFPEHRETLGPLFKLASHLKRMLAPEVPPAAYQEQLLTALLQIANESSSTSSWQSRLNFWPGLSEQILGLSGSIRLPQPRARQMLVRAAAGSAGLAAAGVAAYALYGRLSDRGANPELESTNGR
jgi:hypothetical protein